MKCARCGGAAVYKENGPHIEAKCSQCLAHIKFVPKGSIPAGTKIEAEPKQQGLF